MIPLCCIAAAFLQGLVPIAEDPVAHASTRVPLIGSVDAKDHFAYDDTTRWRVLPGNDLEVALTVRSIEYGNKLETRYDSVYDPTGRFKTWRYQKLTDKDMSWIEENYDYETGFISIKWVNGATTTESKVPIPKDVDLTREWEGWFRTTTPQLGTKAECRMYSSDQWISETAEYEGDETIEFKGVKIKAHRIAITSAGVEKTEWLGPNAEVLFNSDGRLTHWQSAVVPTNESQKIRPNVFAAYSVNGGIQLKTPSFNTLFNSSEAGDKHYRLLEGVSLDGPPGEVSNPLLSYPASLSGHDVWPLEIQVTGEKANITLGRLVGDPPPKWAAIGWAWGEIFPGGGRDTAAIEGFPVVAGKPDNEYSARIQALRTYATPNALKAKEEPPYGIARFDVSPKERKAVTILQVRRYPNGVLAVDTAELQGKEVQMFRYFLVEA